MLGSVVLDVAIGMVFIFLLLSLIASAVLEILFSFVQARSANLHRGLRSLFSEESIASDMTLVDSLYNHGLIRGLYQDHAWDPAAPGSPPSAPLRLIEQWEVQVKKLRRWLQVHLGIAPRGGILYVHDLLELPSYIPSRTFSIAMVDILNPDKFSGSPVHNITDFLARHHGQFPNNKAVQAMLALSVDAKGDLKKLQTNLENWYNDSMDRASGWYKKNTQNVLLMVGLVLAVAFNVDSVQVGRALWLDRDARQGMVDQAQQYIRQQSNAPTSATSAAPDPDPVKEQARQEMLVKELSTKLKTTADSFKAVSGDLLPVGWDQYAPHLPDKGAWSNIRFVLERLFGWIITAVAISLGAPFWFDTLNKFMVVRSTIKPQEKSRPEPSKD